MLPLDTVFHSCQNFFYSCLYLRVSDSKLLSWFTMPRGDSALQNRFIWFAGGSVPCFREALGQNRDHWLTFHSLFNCETKEMLDVYFHFSVVSWELWVCLNDGNLEIWKSVLLGEMLFVKDSDSRKHCNNSLAFKHIFDLKLVSSFNSKTHLPFLTLMPTFLIDCLSAGPGNSKPL